MLKLIRAILLQLICARADGLGLVIGGIMWLLGGVKRTRAFRGSLWLETSAQAKSAITLAPHVRAIRDIRRVHPFDSIVDHEEHHGEQSAAAAVAWLPVDALLVASWGWWALAFGCCSHYLLHAAGYATAWLRGEHVYRGSHAEEAARAVAGQPKG